ncbi:uncharacterized protein LOC106474739 [Limulus polyphemus]|uniref:Uncharacterized protein LOC106474739 n=1 Tax=Limulus polyphemus TaxID=6850 RepID=A0ABM1BY43_LIMPO|nr:uncharacterized protein LOC106474739 [Limulus polyphemus]
MARSTDTEMNTLTQLKGSKINVLVEEALIDLLVVTYHFETREFQGLLLEVSKKNGPPGISSLKFQEMLDSTTRTNEKSEEAFYSLKQRHTYFDPGGKKDAVNFSTTQDSFPSRRRPQGRNSRERQQHVRMRRLRPRPVLCSRCFSMCNENADKAKELQSFKTDESESVKARIETSILPSPTTHKCNNKKASALHTDLSRPYGLPQNPMGYSVGRGRLSTRTGRYRAESQYSKSGRPTNKENLLKFLTGSKNGEPPEVQNAPECKSVPPKRRSSQDVTQFRCTELRKRRSTEDFLEVVKAETNGTSKTTQQVDQVRPKSADAQDNISNSFFNQNKGGISKNYMTTLTAPRTSPVIKISFANPQGQDTVVKIPARLSSESIPVRTDDPDDQCSQEIHKKDNPVCISYQEVSSRDDKAARRAQKRARKEQFPKSTSVLENSGSNHESLQGRHHHKHKTKKKRRDKHWTSINGSDSTHGSLPTELYSYKGNVDFGDEYKYHIVPETECSEEQGYSKNQTLKQKLSISLRRLNAGAYTQCTPGRPLDLSFREDTIAEEGES